MAEGTVSFFMNPVDFSFAGDVVGAYVKGTFTGWKEKKEFHLTKKNDGSWSLVCPLPLVQVPGNSGFPEYKIVLQTECGEEELPVSNDKSRTLLGNNVLLPSADFGDEIKKANLNFGKIKTLSEWDVRSNEQLELLANTRLVPGTRALFRGYHPYKKSRPNLDTENLRSECVKAFLEKNKVASIITLCGDEETDGSIGEKISPYVKEIQRKGNQCFVDTSYEAVYFDSCGTEYERVARTVVQFICTHPAPFYIHCRLGSDRTGTMSAMLAALCGATWNEIAEDYEKTALMGICEYRNRRLLSYSLSRACGEDVSSCENLQNAVSESFIKRGILSAEELSVLQKKLR